MAFWSPEKASCDYPEEEELWSPASASAGGAGGASGDKSLISPSNRGRRVTASRARATSSAGGNDGAGQSGRFAEGFSASDVGGSVADGDEGAPGDSRGNTREEVEWVQCDGCRRWRKLSDGMRSEDLPEQW